MVYIVAYDLKSPNDTESDYQRVMNAVKSYGTTWCHLEKSVWLIVSESSASEIRDGLRKSLFSTDIIFVAKLAGNWASISLGTERVDWLHKQAF